jgi:alkaline phosphatase D
VVFSPWTDGVAGFNSDSWDGYRENRTQVLDHLRGEAIDNVVFLTGDVHSAWAYDVPPPLASGRVYDPETGEGSHAVEFVTPAVCAGSLLSSSRAKKLLDEIEARSPHLKYRDIVEKGFVILDLTAERARAEFIFVDTIAERTAATHAGAILETLSGANHLRRIES